MVNFWTKGCGACKAEMPFLEEVYKTMTTANNKPFKLFTVNIMDHPFYIDAYIKENNFTLPVLLDSDGNVRLNWGVIYIPKTFIIDTDGVIRKVFEGSFDSAQQLKDLLNSL
jgi:thiol-disulfide isomerase/thioredoxin